MWAVIVGALTAGLLVGGGDTSDSGDMAQRPAVTTRVTEACLSGSEASRPLAPGDWVRPEDDAAAPALCRAPEPAAARIRADRAQRRI